ncbi:hypothetical protein ULF88_21420 [Halopseudomonas pachastrellae]|nr:hypothetical protein [Halopseudomonas pachastrellae]
MQAIAPLKAKGNAHVHQLQYVQMPARVAVQALQQDKKLFAAKGFLVKEGEQAVL